MQCTDIAQHVRSNWSSDGVEVESASETKVRCRMPPMFQNLDVFVNDFSEQGCTIDLESRCSNAVVSIALVIYAGSEREQWTYKGHAVQRSHREDYYNWPRMLLGAFVVCTQIFTLYLLRRKIIAFVGFTV